MTTINKYRKKTKHPILDINTSHNWKEVEQSVQDACAGLESLATKDKDMSGSLGRVKRAFRSLCRNAGAGQASSEPRNDYRNLLILYVLIYRPLPCYFPTIHLVSLPCYVAV